MSAFFAVALLSGCSSDAPSSPDENNERQPISLSRGQQSANDDCTAFSLDLFAEVMKNSRDQNAVVSPLSSFMVLGMIGNAVSDEARAEIVAAVGESMETMTDVNTLCLTLLEQLPAADKRSEVSIANSMWLDDLYSMPGAYAALLGDYYLAETKSADFAAPNTLTDINRWCAANTRNHITSILDQLSKEDFGVWLNALYFRGTWRDAFDKSRTEKGDFTLADGTRIKTDMMFCSHPGSSHYGTERFDAISIPYGNRSFYFTAIMPEQGIELDEILQDITPRLWGNIHRSVNNVRGFAVGMPKFSASAKNDLIPYLKDMGINYIFDYPDSFNPIGVDNKYLGVFDQRVEVKADEEGFTAAVVTVGKGQDGAAMSPDMPFYLNRPFYYFVWESSTGAILLAGRLMHP